MTHLVEPLRICRKCGLEAHTEVELELFKKHKDRPHNRDNLCKSCFNKYRINRRATNDRVYLRTKYTSMRQRCYYPPRRREFNSDSYRKLYYTSYQTL